MFGYYKKILANLNSETLILTATQRLTEYLISEHAQTQTTSTWRKPNIQPLSNWLQELVQLNNSGLTLLSDFAELCLWQEIIQSTTATQPILHATNTAKLAMQTAKLIQSWEIPLAEITNHANTETYIFLQWFNQFNDLLKTHCWISKAQLPRQFIQLLQSHQLSLAKNIILTGFDELTPVLTQVCQTLSQHGYHVVVDNNVNRPNQHVNKIALLSQEQEIEAMAKWVNIQAQHTPAPKLVCLVPNLEQCRDLIEWQFKKHCQVPFNITAAKSLSDYPIIRSALNALTLNVDHIERELFFNILTSTFHNSTHTEKCHAASVERALRKQSNLILTVKTIVSVCQEKAAAFNGSQLHKRLYNYLMTLHNAINLKHYPSEWLSVLQGTLQALDWPSQKPLNSENYQIVQRWLQVLQEFAALDLCYEKITLKKAIYLLHLLCTKTLFQKQNIHNGVNIMGLLESGGMEFDQVWLMGLNANHWPPPAQANPFLPMAVQHKYQLPHSSAERELHYSENIQARLFSLSQQIMVSYAEKENDIALLPSKLISDLPSLTANTLCLDLQQPQPQPAPLQQLVDEHAPLLSANESLRGGSQILQQQAECPFKAFVKIRLGAESLIDETLGLDAKARGILTHQVLELFWRQIKTQQALLSLSDSELEKYIDQAIDSATQVDEQQDTEFFDVERVRLKSLIKNWLITEKMRPGFSVLEQETKRYITIGSLPLRITIDRIDELEDGSKLIIDYKTGKNNALSAWFSERLTQPQLPIYACFGIEQAQGICFAQVNAQKSYFIGITATNTELFSKLSSCEKKDPQQRDWNTLVAAWRSALIALSDEFTRGFAAVKPHAQACTYCDLHSFCRIGMHHE